MTEAKDWAGELISGQTTTGRILVSLINSDTCLAYSMSNQRGNFAVVYILIPATLTVEGTSLLIEVRFALHFHKTTISNPCQ